MAMKISTPPHVENLHLVYNCDANYLFLTAVSAKSALRKASDPTRVIVHVLECGFGDEDWARFVEQVGHGESFTPQLYRHHVDPERFAGLRSWRGSIATYARMCAADFLPDLNWCLITDSDSLFTDDPLKLLLFIDDTKLLIGSYDDGRGSRGWYAKMGLSRDWSTYVCCGFVLMNLRGFRKENLPQQCLNFLRAHTDAPFVDQEALNTCCAGRVSVLPREWGIFSECITAVHFPSFIHYVVDVPTRMRFRTRDGFRDVTAVWVKFVRVALGMNVAESCHIPQWQWRFGRAYNHFLRLIIAVLAHTPFGKRWPRMAEFQGLFLPGTVRRKLLSKGFWKKR